MNTKKLFFILSCETRKKTDMKKRKEKKIISGECNDGKFRRFK